MPGSIWSLYTTCLGREIVVFRNLGVVELTVTVDEESEDFVGGGVGNKNGFAYVEEDEIEPLDYDNDDDEYIDEHWDMIDEEKWSCVEAARNELQNEN